MDVGGTGVYRHAEHTMRQHARPIEMLAVSRTAQRLASGYYAFLVAQLVAANPQSINSLQREIGEIKRKDGTAHTLNLRHYLDSARTTTCSAKCCGVGPRAGHGRTTDFR